MEKNPTTLHFDDMQGKEKLKFQNFPKSIQRNVSKFSKVIRNAALENLRLSEDHARGALA